MNIQKIVYNRTTITASLVDQTNQRLWTAFSKNSSGFCILRCSDVVPTQNYFYEIQISVNKIIKLLIVENYIVALYDDPNLLMEKFNLNFPLSDRTTYTQNPLVLDYPIDITKDDNNDVYILFPGILDVSAKVVKYVSFVESEIIELNNTGNIIINASCIVSDGTDLWISTYETPAKLVRVYNSGGYTYSVFIPA